MNQRYDLLIVGGGTAGTLCAIAAARNGISVALIEENSFLGGMACGSGLAEMNAAGFQGLPIYKGIVGEIFDDMIKSGDAAYNFQIPMSSNKDIKIDRLRYNPEILKILLEKKCVEAGVTIYYNTVFLNAEEENNCEITVKGMHKELSLYGKYMVDATGNCDVVTNLGYKTTKPNVENLAVSTMVFRLSNINIPVLQEVITSGILGSIISEGYESGILKGKILAFSPIPSTNDVSVNATRAKFDHENIEEYTRGIIEARGQIEKIVNFIHKNVPGTGNSYISNISPLMGIRDCRKIEGEYKLSLNDLESMHKFSDSIAIGGYPVDVHDPITNTVVWHILPGLYYIPFRSLIPKGSSRVLVVGKCISADEKAFAAIRVMPIVMNIGESAGYIIAHMCKNEIKLSEIGAEDIKNIITNKEISL